MKRILALILTIPLMFLVGCGTIGIESAKQVGVYTIQISDINSDLESLRKETQTAEKMVSANWNKFADEDKANLIVIQQNIKNIFAHLDTLKSIGFYKISISDIEYVYELGKYSHTLGKNIYLKYQGDIPEGERIWWELYDENLKEVKEKIDDLSGNSSSAVITEVLKASLNITNTGLNIILPAIKGVL